MFWTRDTAGSVAALADSREAQVEDLGFMVKELGSSWHLANHSCCNLVQTVIYLRPPDSQIHSTLHPVAAQHTPRSVSTIIKISV